ncbi:MAG: CPBP family glutamic-type intramembrane protease [Planctomycetia bacterium]|nr:CPBP family glutamic-type intramembrane protease [Planctomycetia bacterium]
MNTTTIILMTIICILFIFVWCWLLVRKFIFRIPFLPPLESRKLAKWQGRDVLGIFGLYIFLPPTFFLAFSFIGSFFSEPHTLDHTFNSEIPSFSVSDSSKIIVENPGYAFLPTENQLLSPDSQKSSESAQKSSKISVLSDDAESPEMDLRTQHPLFQFLQTDPSVFKYFFAFFFAVLWIPFIEEFLFRVILQGWCEKKERLFFGISRQNGWRSVFFIAIFFSLMHYRSADTPVPDVQELWLSFIANIFGQMILLICVFVLFIRMNQITLPDLGIQLRYWKKDISYGILAFSACALPVYLIQGALTHICTSHGFSADQFSLIPISLVFGMLYWRTHRILPSFVTHAIFNLTAVLATFPLPK